MLGHADFVGAGEPVRIGADRYRARRVRRNLQPHEHGIVALEHVIHQAGDGQPRGHRVAKRTCGEAVRQLPVDAHRQTGVTGIEPVSMPTGRGPHVDRELELAAWRRGSLRDQFGLDAAR